MTLVTLSAKWCAQALDAVAQSPRDYHVTATAAAVVQMAKERRPDFSLRTDALEVAVATVVATYEFGNTAHRWQSLLPASRLLILATSS